jgi:hypothetical protein
MLRDNLKTGFEVSSRERILFAPQAYGEETLKTQKEERTSYEIA